MKRFFMLLMSLCLLAAPAFAEDAEAPATLTAVGTAETQLRNDYGILHFALEEKAVTVTEAQAKMDALLAALSAALEAQGIAVEEIRAANYELHAVYEYNHTKYGENRTLTGYEVQTMVEVHVENTDKAVSLISAVDEAGVKCSYDLTYETREDSAAYAAALKSAAQEAMRNAQVLSEASGLTLGSLVSIEETEEASMAVVKVTYSVR